MEARTFIWRCAGVLIALSAMQTSIRAQVEVAAPPSAVPPPVVAKPAAISPQDLAFGRFIALIRGHLLTGDELVSRGEWDAARPHFSFPTEEIYGIIRDDVRTYHTPPFDGALKALVHTVRAHSAKQFPQARQKVEDALAAADAALKARQLDWTRFTVAVAVEVLKAAPDEYDDAFANGRIVHPIGYQTARGFVLQAERMFESAAGGLAGDNTVALGDIRAGFTQLKQALMNINAPKQATIDYTAVVESVSKIESAGAKLI